WLIRDAPWRVSSRSSGGCGRASATKRTGREHVARGVVARDGVPRAHGAVGVDAEGVLTHALAREGAAADGDDLAHWSWSPTKAPSSLARSGWLWSVEQCARIEVVLPAFINHADVLG